MRTLAIAIFASLLSTAAFAQPEGDSKSLLPPDTPLSEVPGNYMLTMEGWRPSSWFKGQEVTNAQDPKQVDFHIVPALGAGIFLEDSKTKSVSNNGFFIVRVPGLILPRFSVGMQVELSKAPDIEYAIGNYARFSFTEHVSAGANVRLWRGGGAGRIEYALKVTPVVGFRLLTVADRVPLFLEAEFLDDQSPVKVALIVTWEN